MPKKPKRRAAGDDYKPSELSQWDRKQDAFFKKVFLGSRLLRTMIADKFDMLSDDLHRMDRYPTEYWSNAVGAALHHSGPWKELRSDGIYKAGNGIAIGIEHQSTPSAGLPIRVHMYKTAFLEEHEEIAPDDVKFVVVYSGDRPGIAHDRHTEMTRKLVEYLYIDLNEIPAHELENDGIYSLVIRLGRIDAGDIEQFQLAANMIKSADIEETEKNDLMTALVVASANKPDLFNEVLERVKMNSVVKRNLVEAYPRLKMMSENLPIREDLLARAARRHWPSEISYLIDNIEDERLAELGDRLIDAEISQDWDELIDEANEIASGPAFR